MTVESFCDKFGGKELYEKCEDVWKGFEGRDFARECQVILLERLGFKKTRIAVFCLSDNA